MNNERRNSLKEIQIQIESLTRNLEVLKEGEEEYRRIVYENLKESEQYRWADVVCDLLQEALDRLDDASHNIEEAITIEVAEKTLTNEEALSFGIVGLYKIITKKPKEFDSAILELHNEMFLLMDEYTTSEIVEKAKKILQAEMEGDNETT